MLDLTKIEERLNSATPGPWFYNGYNTITTKGLWDAYDAFWTNRRINDGHTYEHTVGEQCPACGDRPVVGVNGERIGTYWGCERSVEAYYAEPVVATVPAHHGDTAIGRYAIDAEFIANAPTDIADLLAEVKRLKRLLKEKWAFECGEK